MNRTLILFYIILLSVVKLEGKNAYLAPVCNNLDKWGYINEKGKIVVSFKYEFAFPFAYNKALALKKGKWLLLDKISLKEEILDNYLQNYFSDMFVEVKEKMIFDPRMNYDTYEVLVDVLNQIPYDYLIEKYNLLGSKKIPYWKNTFILLNPDCFLISLSEPYEQYVIYNYKSHALAFKDTLYFVELYNYNNIIIANKYNPYDTIFIREQGITMPEEIIFSNNLEILSLDSIVNQTLQCVLDEYEKHYISKNYVGIGIYSAYFRDTCYLEIGSYDFCINYFAVHNDNGKLKIERINRKFELKDIKDSINKTIELNWNSKMKLYSKWSATDSSLGWFKLADNSNTTQLIIDYSKPMPVCKRILSEEKTKENWKKGKFEFYYSFGVFYNEKVVRKPKYRYIGIFN